MAVAGPVAKPHLCIISTGNKHLAGWHLNLAFKHQISCKSEKENVSFAGKYMVRVDTCYLMRDNILLHLFGEHFLD